MVNKAAKKLGINLGVALQPNRKAAKFTKQKAEKVLREEEEEMPVVAVQAKVFTMEIVKKKEENKYFQKANPPPCRLPLKLLLNS